MILILLLIPFLYSSCDRNLPNDNLQRVAHLVNIELDRCSEAMMAISTDFQNVVHMLLIDRSVFHSALNLNFQTP